MDNSELNLVITCASMLPFKARKIAVKTLHSDSTAIVLHGSPDTLGSTIGINLNKKLDLIVIQGQNLESQSNQLFAK